MQGFYCSSPLLTSTRYFVKVLGLSKRASKQDQGMLCCKVKNFSSNLKHVLFRGREERTNGSLKMVLWHVTPLHMTMPTLEVIKGAAVQVFSYC